MIKGLKHYKNSNNPLLKQADLFTQRLLMDFALKKGDLSSKTKRPLTSVDSINLHKMSTLSVIIITKNEQAHIGDCIQSVAGIADEIIVLDSQSTDQTQEIAKSLGAKVDTTTDWQGFGVQKNRALALATSDWVLSLDADERVTPELAQEIESVVHKRIDSEHQNSRDNYFYINRQSFYCGRRIKHSGWQDDQILRLFKRGAASFTNDRVHERIIKISSGQFDPLTQQAPSEPSANRHKSVLKGVLTHYSFTDFDQVLVKINRYSSLWAEQQADGGRTATPFKAAVHGLSAFVKTYIFKFGFLDGSHGFALAVSNAEGAYYKYLKLWHLNATKPL